MSTPASPARKAQRTAKWARTMTKWLIAYRHARGPRWNIVDFGGATGAESSGVVDLMAIRKDHGRPVGRTKRGDLFEVILIQVKWGGGSRRPTVSDLTGLQVVAKHHRAKAVVLATWRRDKELRLEQLKNGQWIDAEPHEIFG